MKILVTGGAGFIGSHLADKLIEKGHEIIIIDNLSTGSEKNLNSQAFFHNIDIADFEKIKPLFQGVDYVFHLAALARVPLSIEDPINTSKTNILGAINVFKASAESGVKRVVFASSSSVYGNQEKMPLKENMYCQPLSPYALQKLTAENFAQLFSDIYKIPIISLRYFNVYGPRLNFDSEYSLVIGKFLKQKKEGKPLTIFDDGEQARGFCYVDDVVEANIKAMESEKIKGGEVINVGSDKSNSINYLAELIGGEVEYFPPRIGDVRNSQADLTLAKELLDWQPKTSFEDGVEIVKKWFEGQ